MRMVFSRRDLLRKATVGFSGLLWLLVPSRSSAATRRRRRHPGVGPNAAPDTPQPAPVRCWVYTYDAQASRQSAMYGGAGKLTKSYEWRGQSVTEVTRY